MEFVQQRGLGTALGACGCLLEPGADALQQEHKELKKSTTTITSKRKNISMKEIYLICTLTNEKEIFNEEQSQVPGRGCLGA